MHLRRYLFFLFILNSCSVNNPWQFDSISSGDKAFSSSKLVYHPKDSFSQFNLEFVYAGDQLFAYITSPSRRLAKDSSTVLTTLKIGGEVLEEHLPLHEGNMRIKLPDSWAKKAIDALKDGQAIDIMTSNIAQLIEPETNSDLFDKLEKGSFSFFETLQGALQ